MVQQTLRGVELSWKGPASNRGSFEMTTQSSENSEDELQEVQATEVDVSEDAGMFICIGQPLFRGVDTKLGNFAQSGVGWQCTTGC